MLNPEFRRNLWLEMTRHRIIGMPLVLGAVFFLVWLLNGRALGEAAASLSLLICGFLVIVWGASLAAESMLAEVRGHTWENQRMTAMSGWQMTWGKLFGGTIYAWYGALLALTVYLLSAPQSPMLTMKHVALLLLAGIFSQAFALLSSMQILKKDRAIARSQATLYAVAGLLAALPMLQLGFAAEGTVQWYRFSVARIDFALVSLLLCAGWAVTGVYRTMRSELQISNGIGVWLLFVLFLMGYLAGFVPDIDLIHWRTTSARLLIAALAVLSLTYLMVLVESKDPVIFSRLRAAAAAGDWRLLNHNLPCWMATLAVALVVCVALALTFPVERGLQSSLFFIALFLFVLRDVAIVLWSNFSLRRKRADMTAILYLAVLYLLLPAIVDAMGWDSLNLLFYPQWRENVPVATALIAVQSTLFLGLAAWRWRRNYGKARVIHE